MSANKSIQQLASEVKQFVRKDFSPSFGRLHDRFVSEPQWRRLAEIGTELWLDTGSLEEAGQLWTREFTALTTNNTLLNREVQRGTYDELVGQAADLLREFGLTPQQMKLELAFILNAYHGLRLVEKFDAHVSVEEHTDLADDVPAAIEYARRYNQICPERFIVKVPLTPAGLLVTRRLAGEGVSVNHTLGFSARQNYVVARLAAPDYVNVFLGRLNSFVADNGLGDGQYVGERATLASQAAIRQLRQQTNIPTKQIGASFRDGRQVRDLAGMDVMTMPPKVAKQFLDLGLSTEDIADKTLSDYQPPLAEGVDPAAVRLETLWDIPDLLVACVDRLEKENVKDFTPDDLVQFFRDNDCGDVLVDWSDSQIATSAAEGKVPQLANWKDALAEKAIGLDALMNLAGLNSFAADQKAMDEHVMELLGQKTS